MINNLNLINNYSLSFLNFPASSLKKSCHSLFSVVLSAFNSLAKIFHRYLDLLHTYIGPKPVTPLPAFMKNSISGCLPIELTVEGIFTHLDLKSIKHVLATNKTDAALLKQPRFLSFLLERQKTNKIKLIQNLQSYEDSTDKIQQLTISMLDLKFGSISDGQLSFIFAKCSNLKRIDLSYCKNITNTALQYLPRHCQNLQDLNLAGSGCNLDDEWMGYLAPHSFVCLTSLSLSHHSIQMTDQGIKSFKASFPNLKSLHLYQCQNIRSQAFSILFESLPQLLTLNIGSCPQVTDGIIADLAQYCLKIQQVILTECLNITDLSLHHLAEHSRELKSLTIISCNTLTLPAISNLMSKCSMLESVHTSFERRQLASLKRQYPRLKITP